MTAPALPQGFGALQDWLQSLDDRLAQVENPQSPVSAYPMASTQLSTTNAAEFGQKFAWITDLKTFAYSTGSHWIRSDSGAQIV